MLPPIDLKAWLAENRHLLQPPVNNYCLHRGNGATTMIVGGPNERTDYHINGTPEWFYQLEGAMTLKVVEDGEFKDIIIREGEIFLLSPNVPHSPCRYANTVGIVVEQDRPKGMLDSLRWYCANCKEIVHEASFYMEDLGTQVKAGIEAFESNMDARTCKSCGTVAQIRPEKPTEIPS